MTAFLKTLAVAALGVALGLLSTWLAVEHGYGFGAVNAGAWTAWPKTGGSDADPYARAVMARTGEIPLSAAEGLSFIAKTDDSGAALEARCDYIIRSPTPIARYWTLSSVTPAGFLPNSKGLPDSKDIRRGFTSAEVVRATDGAFEIALSREVRPGNWLPLPDASAFHLMLRLYDTQVSSTSAVIDARVMPKITRGACS